MRVDTSPSSPTRPRALPHSRPSPPAPSPRAGCPTPARAPLASSHRHPPTCTSRPFPIAPIPAWACPPPRSHSLPVPSPRPHTPSAAQTTGQETDRGLGPSATWGRGTWRAGRGWGSGPARWSSPQVAAAAAAAVRGSPGPGAAPGVLPQPPSPAERRRGHQHF